MLYAQTYPLSIVLGISGIDAKAPANMYSFSIMAPLLAPIGAWIAVANTNTMNEWSKGYVTFGITPDGKILDTRDPKARKALGITNPITGKILLAPAHLNGKRTNWGVGDTIIHEVKHYMNWKNKIFQGSHPIMSDLDEISAYIHTGQWTGSVSSGINEYFLNVSDYILKIQNIKR